MVKQALAADIIGKSVVAWGWGGSSQYGARLVHARGACSAHACRPSIIVGDREIGQLLRQVSRDCQLLSGSGTVTLLFSYHVLSGNGGLVLSAGFLEMCETL